MSKATHPRREIHDGLLGVILVVGLSVLLLALVAGQFVLGHAHPQAEQPT